MKPLAPLLPKGFGAKALGPSSTSSSPDSTPGEWPRGESGRPCCARAVGREL